MRRLVGGEAVGREAETVVPLEGLGQRGGDVVELGPMAERRLERRQGGERVTRGGKELPEAWRVDAEQDRAVLEEAPAAPPLGAADDLAPVDFNLVAPGPREAERGRRDSAARDRDHLDGRAERPKPGDQGAPDPPIGLEQVARTAEFAAPSAGSVTSTRQVAVMARPARASGSTSDSDRRHA